MKSIIVIPARFASTRFPGKPLAQIAGHSLLHRVWKIAKAVQNIDEVFIATDNPRIEEFAKGFGANVVMTPEECPNGTERAYETVKALGIEPQVIVNLQGDALLTPPWVIQDLVNAMLENPNLPMATPAVQLNEHSYSLLKKNKESGIITGTLVTFDLQGKALYFSKALIPNLRVWDKQHPPVYQHIGIYAYTWQCLQQYRALAPTPFEQAEQLEQLRALENGIPIQVVQTQFKGRSNWAIDCPEDVQIAEDIIAKEGELVPWP